MVHYPYQAFAYQEEYFFGNNGAHAQIDALQPDGSIIPQYHLMTNQHRRVFRIDVSGITPEDAERTLRQMLASYKEDIPFPENVQISINEISNHNHEIWEPVRAIGSRDPNPETEIPTCENKIWIP